VLILGEGIRRFLAEVEIDPTYRHVHRRQPPGGGIALIRLLPPQPHPAGALRTSQISTPRPLVSPIHREIRPQPVGSDPEIDPRTRASPSGCPGGQSMSLRSILIELAEEGLGIGSGHSF